MSLTSSRTTTLVPLVPKVTYKVRYDWEHGLISWEGIPQLLNVTKLSIEDTTKLMVTYPVLNTPLPGSLKSSLFLPNSLTKPLFYNSLSIAFPLLKGNSPFMPSFPHPLFHQIPISKTFLSLHCVYHLLIILHSTLPSVIISQWLQQFHCLNVYFLNFLNSKVLSSILAKYNHMLAQKDRIWLCID